MRPKNNDITNHVFKNSLYICLLCLSLVYVFTRDILCSIIFCLSSGLNIGGFYLLIKRVDDSINNKKLKVRGRYFFYFFLYVSSVVLLSILTFPLNYYMPIVVILGMSVVVLAIFTEAFRLLMRRI